MQSNNNEVTAATGNDELERLRNELAETKGSNVQLSQRLEELQRQIEAAPAAIETREAFVAEVKGLLGRIGYTELEQTRTPDHFNARIAGDARQTLKHGAAGELYALLGVMSKGAVAQYGD